MNQRERFLNTMRFKSVDRVPLWIPWFWPETLERWYSEGLPALTNSGYKSGMPTDINLEELFGCDTYIDVGTYYGFCPSFEETLLEEDEKTRTYINFEGIKMREMKENRFTSMPQFLEFPVKNREDYRKLKHRLQLNEALRFPKDWESRCKLWKNRKIPLRMWGDREAGFFGPLRNLMGVENLCMAFYDEPELIEEMMEDRADLIISILDKILKGTDFDFFVFWEDMAYKNGPLLSPELFKKFMVPKYKKVTDFLRSKGVDIILVDSDGDITKLIPLWLEAGVNGMWPFEVQCGMDVVKLRKQYGNDLLMVGGIDKRVISQGKKEIDEEIEKIFPILSKGGFIPWPDHSIPPNASLDNFLYFMNRLEKAINNA